MKCFNCLIKFSGSWKNSVWHHRQLHSPELLTSEVNQGEQQNLFTQHEWLQLAKYWGHSFLTLHSEGPIFTIIAELCWNRDGQHTMIREESYCSPLELKKENRSICTQACTKACRMFTSFAGQETLFPLYTCTWMHIHAYLTALGCTINCRERVAWKERPVETGLLLKAMWPTMWKIPLEFIPLWWQEVRCFASHQLPDVRKPPGKTLLPAGLAPEVMAVPCQHSQGHTRENHLSREAWLLDITHFDRARTSPMFIHSPTLLSSPSFHPHWLRAASNDISITRWAATSGNTPGLTHLLESQEAPWHLHAVTVAATMQMGEKNTHSFVRGDLSGQV